MWAVLKKRPKPLIADSLKRDVQHWEFASHLLKQTALPGEATATQTNKILKIIKTQINQNSKVIKKKLGALK
jgi:hypothetical protein